MRETIRYVVVFCAAGVCPFSLLHRSNLQEENMQLRQAVSQLLQGQVPAAQPDPVAGTADALMQSQGSVFSSKTAVSAAAAAAHAAESNASADAVRRNRAVTVLQAAVRGWLARKKVRKMCEQVLQQPSNAKYADSLSLSFCYVADVVPRVLVDCRL